MNESIPSSLAAQIAELSRRLERLEERLADLEHRGEDLQPTLSERPAAGAGAAATVASRRTGPGTLPLIGQTFLILGGAFLLRALTEGGTLPQLTGTSLAFVYALVWFFQCDRAAAGGRHATAAFRGLAAVLIAYPLLWEATASFGFVSPEQGALALTVTGAVGLVIAWHRHLRVLAWLVAGSAVPTAIAIGFSTGHLAPFLACLLLLGLATTWLAYLRRWSFIAFGVAVIVDFVMLLLVVLALRQPPPPVVQGLETREFVALLLGLVLVYSGSATARSLVRSRNLRTHEMAQTTVALLIGLGGAWAIERSTGSPSTHYGIIALLLAAGCYAASFVSIDRRLGRGRNFLFYTTLGLVLMIFACAVLLGAGALSMALAVAAVMAAAVGARCHRATLSLHGAIYLLVSALLSGLLGASLRAFGGPASHLATWSSPSMLAGLLAAAVTTAMPVETHHASWRPLARTTQLVRLLVLAPGVGGLLVAMLTSLLPVGEEAVTRPGALAALRTGVIAVLVVVLAWAGGRSRTLVAGWLVYPLLVVGGVKLLVEDVHVGRASTLVASMVLYGLALILAPRLRRKAAAATAERGADSAERGADSAERGADSAERGADSAERGADSAELTPDA
ncbi:MAG: hypothetical protein PVF43_08685 [Candidatus Eiseniibacteriota bacterium]